MHLIFYARKNKLKKSLYQPLIVLLALLTPTRLQADDAQLDKNGRQTSTADLRDISLYQKIHSCSRLLLYHLSISFQKYEIHCKIFEKPFDLKPIF